MLTVKKPHIPDFRAVRRVLAETAQEVAEERVAEFVEQEKDVFVSRIKAQDFSSFDAHPLAPRYRAFKVSHGLDPRIMIASGYYVNHIRVWRHRPAPRTLMLRVGFHPKLLARDRKGHRIPGLLMSTLAAVHEKGSTKLPDLPKRPHWGPHYKEMRVRAKPVRVRIKADIRTRAKARLTGVL